MRRQGYRWAAVDAAAVELVRWETCPVEGCRGARVRSDGACVAHMPPTELDQLLARLGRGATLDARGVIIDEQLLQRILRGAPRGDCGRPRLRKARFDRATFPVPARFDAVVFERDTSFDGATFAADASFVEARFDGHVRFAKAAFTGRARFDDASFAGQAWFAATSFAKEVSFERARFGGVTWFGTARFAADVDFSNATFAGDVSFSRAEFGCHTFFTGAAFDGEAVFDETTFANEANYRGSAFRGKGGAPQAAVRQAIWSGAALAPWTTRALAAVIDAAVPLAFVLGALGLNLAARLFHYEGALVPLLVVAGGAGLVFTVWNLIGQGHSGQTIGKRRMGVCLVRERDGFPVGPGPSLARQLLHGVFDALPLGVGFLRPLWDAKRQTFADRVLTTVVIVRTGWAREGSSDSFESPVRIGGG